MSKTFPWLLAVLMSLAALPAAAADADEYANIHTVAVASGVGDAYVLYNKGLTIFDTTKEEVPIADWGIDQWLEDSLKQALSPRFVVKTASVDRALLARCDDLDQCLAALPRRQDLDAYVIAIKREIMGPGGSEYYLRGLGQLHSGGPFGLHFEEIYAAYEIVVVDARTGRYIDSGSARMPGGSLFSTNEPIVGDLPASVWPGTAAQMSADQKALAKETVTRLVRDSFQHGLENANLTGLASPAQSVPR